MLAKTEWPADRVKRRKVAQLVPYAHNARLHSDEQVDQLVASIKEWGWTMPILLDEKGGIIAGHGRVLAAKKMGLIDVPCMVAAGWTETQRKAYVIADNKLALNANWDDKILSSELLELKEIEFDLPVIGFNETEIDKLLTLPEPANVAPQLQETTFQVIVSCDDEMHQADLLARFEQEGLKCRPLML
jgi:ParB-like chromosome segregation protein Spo0J